LSNYFYTNLQNESVNVWFLVENIGQYACDKTANFEGKYLEQFKNKQD